MIFYSSSTLSAFLLFYPKPYIPKLSFNQIMTPENPIVELIDKYKPLKEKYQLPEFSELNKLFDIEDIDSESEKK